MTRCKMGAYLVATIVVLIILYCYYLRREMAAVGRALAAVNTSICTADISAATCTALMAPADGPPDPLRPAAPGVDTAALAFAVRINAVFVAYLGAPGRAALMGSPGGPAAFGPPRFTSAPGDPMPIAATWVSADGAWAVVVIRGTMTAADLAADLNFNYEKTTGDTHTGLTLMYSTLAPALWATVPATATRLTLTGHSLGAALAFLMAAAAPPALVVDAYGVAPPRVGGPAFVAALQAKPGRRCSLINMADTVPSLPWTYMPSLVRPNIPVAFAHVGPIAAFNLMSSDLISDHMLPTYAAGLPTAAIISL